MRILSAVLATVLLCGCSDDTGTSKVDQKVKRDGLVIDGPVTDGPVTKVEGLKVEGLKVDGAVASALQAVINKITLPNSANEYAYDYDGSGKKNGLGGINGLLKTLGLGSFDFQTNIDLMVNQGDFLMLLDVQAKSIVNDAAMKVQAFQGEDLDSPANAADNFSGSEQLGVKIGTPQNLILNGTIASNKIVVGPGTLVFPIPMGTTPVTVSLVKARIEATLSSTPLSAMKDGRLYGAIPWTDVDTKLLPMMATSANTVYNDAGTSAAIKTALKVAFDPNNDGTITTDEIRNSLLLAIFLKADVDTDGDKTNDALSVGIAFTGVGCAIKK